MHVAGRESDPSFEDELAEMLLDSRGPKARVELAGDIFRAAHLRGDFVLSSGARSTYYFDKYLFETKPSILRRLATALADMVPPGVSRIAGPELGAVALATAVSLEMGIPFTIVRRSAKAYGTGAAIEGELYPGEHVCVIEDVISTGTQAIAAARRVEEVGGIVVAVLGVIDRVQGGSQNIEGAGYAFDSIFRLSDFQGVG